MKYLLWLFPIMFYVSVNNYYGWNDYPKSDGELIADGIVLILALLVVIILGGEK